MNLTAIAVASAFALILLRLGADQVHGYRLAMQNIEAGNKKNAIMYFEQVLNAHIPFSPLEERAKNRLIKLGDDFEKNGDLEPALLCYETLRTTRYLTRHFAVPDSESLPLLNRKIAAVKADILARDDAGLNFKEEYDRQMQILQRDFSPSVGRSLIAVISFLAYIWFIVFWILKQRRQYIYLSCVFFVIWATVLYIA